MGNRALISDDLAIQQLNGSASHAVQVVAARQMQRRSLGPMDNRYGLLQLANGSFEVSVIELPPDVLASLGMTIGDVLTMEEIDKAILLTPKSSDSAAP
ncbi:hypothetical protein [Pseudomonas farris]